MSDDPNDRGLSRKHLFHSIDASLKRLGTDYVDVFQMHRWDPHTPVEETLTALNDIVRAGKALYIGASTMAAWQFAKLLYTADALGVARPVSMQPYYNLLYREEEREMIPLCRAEGVAVIPYSPIARGFVTGERRKEDWGDTVRAKTDDYMKKLYYTPQDFAITERITDVSRRRGLPQCPGCVGLGFAPARNHGAHCRRDEARATGSTCRRAAGETRGGGVAGLVGGLPAEGSGFGVAKAEEVAATLQPSSTRSSPLSEVLCLSDSIPALSP